MPEASTRIDYVPVLFYICGTGPSDEMQALKMSRLKFGAVECEANTFHLARFSRRRSFIFSFANFATLSVSFLVCWDSETSRAQQADFSIYARAVEFCRGNVKRHMVLDLDKRILCLDGELQS